MEGNQSRSLISQKSWLQTPPYPRYNIVVQVDVSMAWLGKFQNLSSNLGNLSDLAGAVSKLSESVKNIERNFDSALGFDDRSNDGNFLQSSTSLSVVILPGATFFMLPRCKRRKIFVKFRHKLPYPIKYQIGWLHHNSFAKLREEALVSNRVCPSGLILF